MSIKHYFVISCMISLSYSGVWAHGGQPHEEAVAEMIDLTVVSPWLAREERSRLRNLGIAYTDQDRNRGVLQDLLDKPTVIAFFYSRCPNNYKCSLAITNLAALQDEVEEAGLDQSVRLVAITFEPQFDTPERIKRFAGTRGLRFGPSAKALRLDPEGHDALMDELELPISTNAGWVTAHGMVLAMFDGEGRLVRKYETILWDNEDILADFRRLLDEG